MADIKIEIRDRNEFVIRRSIGSLSEEQRKTRRDPAEVREMLLRENDDLKRRYVDGLKRRGLWPVSRTRVEKNRVIKMIHPAYNNTVTTGYEWTVFNRAHYDRHNPPPSAVQGYQFCIHYPKIDDPQRPPTWVVEASDAPGTVMLVFRGGPPYSDISFRIINREWDVRGWDYVNKFEDGTLHLSFSMKKHKYRK